MESDNMIIQAIAFPILLIIELFVSCFGYCLPLLNRTEIDRSVEQEKDKRAMLLQKILEHQEKYLNTVALITALIHITIGYLHLHLTVYILRQSFSMISILACVIGFLAILYLVMIFGVLIPQRIAQRIADKWAAFWVKTFYYMTLILTPFTFLPAVTVDGIMRILGIRNTDDEGDVTEEEIINMVNEGHEQGIIQSSEAKMISNIFEFDDKEAQDIMTHRNQIVFLEEEQTLTEAVEFMLQEKYSRYPVEGETIDQILGIIHLKDALRLMNQGEAGDKTLCKIPGLLREPLCVPQTKKIDELFRDMQAKKTQMAIVIDEYGQTDGLVAMEDILEEIVGNILDEYDEDQTVMQSGGKDEYIVAGTTRLEDIEDKLGIDFENMEFETINGFMISKLDRIPEPNEVFDVDYCGYNFKILSVKNKMIETVRIKKLPDPQENVSRETVLEENEK